MQRDTGRNAHALIGDRASGFNGASKFTRVHSPTISAWTDSVRNRNVPAGPAPGADQGRPPAIHLLDRTPPVVVAQPTVVGRLTVAGRLTGAGSYAGMVTVGVLSAGGAAR